MARPASPAPRTPGLVRAGLPETPASASPLAALALAALVIALLPPAYAQELPTDDQVDRAVAAVDNLLNRNRAEEALTIIRPIAEARPDSPRATFAAGLAAVSAADKLVLRGGANPRKSPQKDYYDLAVKSFRGMLVKDPSLQRVRLELARSLFRRGDCTRPPRNLVKHILGDDCWAAQQHFLRVLGSGVPPSVVLTVRGFIQAIRARKRASGSLSLALAPDTNVNTATSAHTVQIFGLPFQLDDDARATSGIGVVGALSTEIQRPMPKFKWMPGKVARLRVGANIYRRDYSGGFYDDSNYGIFAGPRFLGDRGEVSVLFQADRRQVNGRPYSRQFGLRVEGARLITRKMWLGGTAEGSRMTPLSDLGRAGDVGFSWNGLGYATYALMPSLTLRFMGGVSREQTGRLTTRHQSRWVGVTGNYDLPYGFTLSAAQQLYFTRYDKPLPLFGSKPPSTKMWFSRLAVYNRLINLKGFSPSISLVREDRASNLTLFTYKRYRVESGVVRVF